MPILPAVLLLAILVLVGVYLRNDAGEYARFKALTETGARQKTYARWVRQSLLIFGVSALVGLAVLGRLEAVLRLPAEFLPLHAGLKPGMDTNLADLGGGFIGGVVGAAIIGLVGGALLARRKGRSGKPVVMGDIEPLLPRNGAERVWGGLLSLNAGISEELFFRLLLPLLLTLLIGNAVVAFVISAVLFGLIHFYQGWKGVLATGVLGGLFTVIYLVTGLLWVAMLLHALIDLNALVLQSWLRGRKANASPG